MARTLDLPVLERVEIDNYLLYPGKNDGGLAIDIPAGVSVVVGINGLGKTTLLNAILRGILGPSELPKKTIRDLGRSVKRELRSPARFTYFAERVSDHARNATLTVTYRLAKQQVVVKRALSNLRLLDFQIGKRRFTEKEEGRYLEEVAELAGVSNAYEFHVLVRFVQFFLEERPPILWDGGIQFEILRVLIVDKKVAKKLADTFAELQSLDSRVRNTEWLLNKKLDDLKNVPLPEQIKDLRSELDAAEVAESAAVAAQHAAQAVYDQLKDKQRKLEANVFRKSIDIEKQSESVSSLHYDYLAQQFPNLSETAQYLMHAVAAESVCLICGTAGEEPLKRVIAKTREHTCPLCDSAIAVPKNVIPFSVKALREEAAVLENDRRVYARWREDLAQVSAELSDAIDTLQRANTDVYRARALVQEIKVRLPDSPNEVAELRADAERTRVELEADKAKRGKLSETYRKLVASARDDIEAIQKKLHQRFVLYARAFLKEEVDLVLDNRKVLLVTGYGRVMIPSFRVEMASPANPGLIERETMESVSESQKEFLDLAFRMALMDVIAPNPSGAMLVIETPEASLDAIFIRRAAQMLREFGAGSTGQQNRTVLTTSNLTGAKMISALLGLKKPQDKLARRDRNRVINLLDYAAPPASFKAEQAAFKRVLQEALHDRKPLAR